MSMIPNAMIDVPMDGRELELLKVLLDKAINEGVDPFKIREYQLLIEKFETHKKLHHENHYRAIMTRYSSGGVIDALHLP